MEINGVSTLGMSHAEAIDLIKRDNIVRLLIRRSLSSSETGQCCEDVWVLRNEDNLSISTCSTTKSSFIDLY